MAVRCMVKRLRVLIGMRAVVLFPMAFFSGLVLSGCQTLGRESSAVHPLVAPSFREIYEEMTTSELVVTDESGQEATFSYAVDGMPVGPFLQLLTQDTGVSLAWAEKLDSRKVSLQVEEMPVTEILSVVARRLGVELTGRSGLFFLGQVSKEDRAVLVTKVARLNEQELLAAVEVLLSDFGRARVYSDGLVVIADRVEVLQKVSDLLDKVESAPSNSWVVQLHLLEFQGRSERDFGFDTDVSLQLAAGFASDGATGDSFKYDGAFNAALQAAMSRESVHVVAQPLFFLLDGESASFETGEIFPVPRRSTSPEGTTVTEGFDFIDTGFRTEVAVRELGDSRIRLDVDISLSDVSGFVQDVPIVSRESFKESSVLRSNGTYLLGLLERSSRRSGSDGSFFPTSFERNAMSSRLQIWARCVQVIGDFDGSPSPARGGKGVSVEVVPSKSWPWNVGDWMSSNAS